MTNLVLINDLEYILVRESQVLTNVWTVQMAYTMDGIMSLLNGSLDSQSILFGDWKSTKEFIVKCMREGFSLVSSFTVEQAMANA